MEKRADKRRTMAKRLLFLESTVTQLSRVTVCVLSEVAEMRPYVERMGADAVPKDVQKEEAFKKIGSYGDMKKFIVKDDGLEAREKSLRAIVYDISRECKHAADMPGRLVGK